MKKLLNVLGVLLALAAVGFGFVSCDNDVSGVSGGRPAITAFTAEQNGEAITFKWKVRGISDNDIEEFNLEVKYSDFSRRLYSPTDPLQSNHEFHWEKDGDWFVYEVSSREIERTLDRELAEWTAYLKGFYDVEKVMRDAATGKTATCTFDYTAPASVE